MIDVLTNLLKNKKIIFLYCFLIAFIAITICSKNSFLYPFNNWVDENAFMTVGKSWSHGMIPYKDLFEHKGPFLYFIFMLGYLISNHTFLGIYIFEVISFTCLLYITFKIIKLYLKESYGYLILPLFASLITASPFFVHGGSGEEFTLPLLAYMLFSYLQYFKTEKISNGSLFLNGLYAGLVFMIKFNMLGFWFVFMASLFIFMIQKKEIKKAFLSCVFFLCGMIIPIIIFLIYFYLIKGLNEFIDVYFIFNLTGYGSSASVNIFTKLSSILSIIFEQLTSHFLIFNLIYVGMIYFVFNNKFISKWEYKCAFIFMFLLGDIGIYWGCLDFPYYFLILVIFIITGFISFFQFFKEEQIKIFIVPIIIVSGVLLYNSQNIPYMKNNKNELVQYKFANLINKTKNAKVLNYGFGDGGFYMAADILPASKYFQNYNGGVLGMAEELEKNIKDKYYDYVITRSYDLFSPINNILEDNYENIAEEKEISEEILFTYNLFKRK